MHFAPVSLSALVDDLAAGRTTPVATIAAAIERIEAVDGEIGAFVHRASADSIEAAKTATGPLAGVPLAFKDTFDTADMPTEHGSPIHKGFRPAADASLVALARMAGAAILGKTATTAFAFLDPAATRNPINLAHTPGGSSSGSAAAVASGMVAGAFGSQTAGSVIRPASFCGIAGFKPSFRLLPTAGLRPFAWTLDTAGLFAKGVADAALLAALVSGRDLAVTTVPEPSAIRVGLFRSGADDDLDPAMIGAVEGARQTLEAAGIGVFDIEESEELAAGRRIQLLIQLYEGAISLAHERRLYADRLGPRLRAALKEGAAVDAATYDSARRTARRARRAVAPLFDEVDFLLAPSALGPAPETLSSTGSPEMNRLWTLTGNPVVNVPGLRNASGLPLGLSLVGRFGDDRRTLAAGALLERLFA